MRIIIALVVFFTSFAALDAQEKAPLPFRLLEEKKSEPKQTGSISGRVNDASSGKPLSGAIIELLQDHVVIHTTSTNDKGSYAFITLSPGDYTLQVSKTPDFQATEAKTKVIPKQQTILNFTLSTYPGNIMGQVTKGTTGESLQGVLILVEVIDGKSVVASAVTNGEGRYQVDSLTPGSYTIKASTSNFQPIVLSASVKTKQTTTLNIALSPLPGKIRGQVTDTTGKPVARGIITIEEVNSDVVVATGITDRNGSYSLSSVPPGSYAVKASSPEFESAHLGVTVLSNTTTTLNFIMTPLPGIIVGQIRDVSTGLPIQGVIIKVEVIQGGVVVTNSATDTNGNYTISELDPDNYSFRVNAPNFQTAVLDSTIQSDKTTVLNFALTPLPGTLEGQILDALTGDPIQGAIVTVEVAKGRVVVDTGLSDTQGRYSIPSLPPGTYTIWASAPDYQTTRLEATIKPSKPTTTNFVLTPLLGKAYHRYYKKQFVP